LVLGLGRNRYGSVRGATAVVTITGGVTTGGATGIGGWHRLVGIGIGGWQLVTALA